MSPDEVKRLKIQVALFLLVIFAEGAIIGYVLWRAQ